MDIREIDGLWCDDITFCQEDCEDMDCPRNKHNIRDRRFPHSYSVDRPKDCPKTGGTAMKCSDCWYFEESRFGDWHICTVDEDIEEDEPVYTVKPDDEACHRFELNLTMEVSDDQD